MPGAMAPPAPAAAPAMPAVGVPDLTLRASSQMEWDDSDFMMETQADLNFGYGYAHPMADAPAEVPDLGGGAIAEAPTLGGNNQEQPAIHQRMIITTFNLTAETMDFESSVAFIRSITNEFGGYIENSSEDGLSIRFDQPHARFAFFTARVPSGRVHEFVKVLGENTNIISTNEHTSDITNSFFDNQARLASLVNQERLLTELLDSEDAGLHYILEVHRELASVRHQIEFLNTTIQHMQQAVNFSTVTVNLNEVMQYRPVDALPMTFGERLSQASYNSWNNFVRQTQNMAVNTIMRLPFFLLDLLRFAFWIALFLIVRMFIRKRKGRQRGQDTFDWLPVSRMRKTRLSPKPETGGDNR